MLTGTRPYSVSIHSQSKNYLNPAFLNQTGLFNKQRYKRSDSSSEGDKLLRNAELHSALRKKNLSEEKRIERVEQSLKKGANINFSDSTNEYNTPLHTAVQKGYPKVVNFLLQKGADVTLKNKNQETPKDLAAGKPEILAILEQFFPQTSHLVSPNQGEKSVSVSAGLLHPDLNQQSGRVKRPLDAIIEREANIGSKYTKIAQLPDGSYQASGVKASLHGVVYQLKLLMLYAWSGKEKGYSFRLATEMNDAEKFDDVVFQYMKSRTDSTSSRFLQAKHIQVDNEKSEKITRQHLLTESDDKFSLQKYFISYLKIKRNPVFSGLQDFVISTNIDFDFDITFNQQNLKKLSQNLYFEMISDEDDILNIGGERYRFVSKNTDEDKRKEVASELKELFERTSECQKLAAALANHILKGETIGLNNEFFKSYRVPLMRYIIDIGNKQLSKDFLDENKCHSSVIGLRKLFREAVELEFGKLKQLKTNNSGKLTKRDKYILEKKLDSEPPSKMSKTTTSDRSPDAFWSEMSTIKLELSGGFIKLVVLDENPQLSNIEEFTGELWKLINNEKSIINIQRTNNILYQEIGKLAGHILVEVNRDNKKLVVFGDKFLNGTLLKGNLRDFRAKLMENLIVKNFDDFRKKLTRYTFKITGFQTCKESVFDTLLQLKSPLLNPEISDKEVEEFLNKLVFAVNQPNEEKLSQLISKELGEEFNLIDAELITDNFQDKMLSWMKEKQGENRYLSEFDIANFFKETREKISQMVLIGPTSEYTKRIDETGIKFKPESLPNELKMFLEQDSPSSDIVNRIFNIVSQDGETLLESIKVRQILGEIDKYKKDGSYIFIRLSVLFRLKRRVIEAFRKEKANLLIIECHTQEKHVDNSLYDDLLKILKTPKKNIKVLLISSNKNEWVEQFKKISSLKIEDKTGFGDLDEKSKNKLLQNTAYFQGKDNEVFINQIVSKEDTKLTQLLPLADLIKGKKIEIGKPIPISYGYDTDFYIDRTVNKQIMIQPKLSYDMKNYKFNDLVANDKEKFGQLCRQHPNENVHWVQEESGHWLWKKSRGSLTNLRKYISTRQTGRPHEGAQEFLKNTENQQVMLIADTAGMGKTTVLTHLSKMIKKDKPNHWVVRIDLNYYTDALEAQLGKTFTMDSAVDFISDKLLKLENPLEKALFMQSFQSGEAAPLVLMFDGFDEISPSYKETVIGLLTTLKNTAIKQLWVTTRTHLKEALEDKLKQLAYNLVPFSEANQIDFLVRFWKKDLELSEATERLQGYAQQLLEKLASSIKDRDNEFTGIPLQTRMLAESFQVKIKEHLQMKRDTLDLPSKLELIDLYEEFIESKYKIYQSEKLKKDLSNPGVKEEQDSIFKTFLNINQELAIRSIFDEDQISILIPDRGIDGSEEKIHRSGIVSVINNKPHFIHRTFTEYFVAKFLVEKLKNEQQPSEKFQDLFLEILLEDIHKVIRGFINGFLGKVSPKQEIFKQYGNKISELFLSNKEYLYNSHHNTMLFVSVSEDNDAIVQFILECINKTENNEIILYYLSSDVLSRAIFNNNLKIVKILVKNGADVEQTGVHGDTSLHYAVDLGFKDIVDFLIKSKDDGGGGSDINAEDNLERTALHISVDKDNLDIVESLIEKSDINHQDEHGVSVLHNSIHSAHSKEIVEKLVERKVNVNVKDNDGISVLHYAAYNGKFDVIKYLVEHGCDINVKSNDGSTILHDAALSGNINLCEWIVKKNPSFINDKDNNGRTPLHEAAERDRLNIIDFLEKEGGEINSVDEDGNNLLLESAKYSSKTTCEWFINKGFDINYSNKKGKTILHISIKYGNFEVVKWLVSDKGFDPNVKDKSGNPAIVEICKYVPEVQSEELIKRSYLSEDNIHRRLETWYPAETDVEIVRYLIENGVNFNDKDENGKTILHYAAEYGEDEVVKELVMLNNQGKIASKDDKEKSMALILAAKGEHWDIAGMLLNHGADINGLSAEECGLFKDYLKKDETELFIKNSAKLLKRIRRRLSVLPVEYVQEVANQAEQIFEPMDTESDQSCGSRRRRDLRSCAGEERKDQLFPYDPLEEQVAAGPRQAGRLHDQLALAVAWGQGENEWIRYQRYLGEIVEEGVENQSPREQRVLWDHYQQAEKFFEDNPKSGLLQGAADNYAPVVGENVWLQNGQQSWFVFNKGERYQLYSPDFNYRQLFQTRLGVSWSELSRFFAAFFVWKSGSAAYHPLVLKSSVPESVLAQLRTSRVWQPDSMVPDRVVLAERQLGLIEGIPATAVRKLISVKGQMVDWMALHADFFQTPGIQLRLDRLHQMLPELNDEQRRHLVRLVNHYGWSADSTVLERCSAEERAVLADYQQQLITEFKKAVTITPERLSELSWQALAQAIEKQSELPAALKQPVLDNLKAMHSTATGHAWTKGMATQSLFFLPDMIRAANTGQVGGLVSTTGMLVTDGGVNNLYGRLLERLAPTLSESRLGLLQKLPVTSPVFKALTVYSIVELTQQLRQLPVDAPQRQTIKHRLGEQYVTIGIMAAELLGLETGPLWIGLMAEQLVFEAVTFRKENQLDIPFWEAFIMSLGFEQNKLQHIVEERQLLDVNLATVDSINPLANPPYGWALVKIPSLGPLVWTSLAESQVPRNISTEITQQPEPFSFNVATAVRESKGFRQIRRFKIDFAPTYNAPVATRGELIETQWQRGIYHATSASTRIDVVPIGYHCQEDNIFLDSPKGLMAYKRVASVIGDSYQFCPSHIPVKITGPGLAALYANNHTFVNQNAQRNLYLGFDPCEGNITLHFHLAGLHQLAVINRQHNPQYSPDLHVPYHITIQVGHKNYPDSILFSHEGGVLTLHDPTQRINSHYFIDYDTRPFHIRDDATVTKVAFTPTKSLGYRLQSDGPESIRLYSPQRDTFSTLLLKRPKQQLHLRLLQQRIVNVLMLSAEQVEIFSAHGEDAYRSGIFLTNHVTRFTLTVVGNLQIMQEDTHLFVIGENPDNTTEIQYAKNPSMPYQLTLATLQSVIETLHRPNPQECHFVTLGVKYAWVPGQSSSAILQIVGDYQGQLAQLLLEKENATLSQLAFNQPSRTLVVFHFIDSVALDPQLRLQQVLPANHTGSGLRLQSLQGDEVLHYFEQDTFTINGIHYQVHGKQLYATGAEQGVIDGQQLLRYRHANQGVTIRVARSLSRSTVEREGQETLKINQLKLHHLPKRTLISFKQQTFPWQALQETVHRHRHHHQRSRRHLPGISSSASRPTPWITQLWQGLRGIMADTDSCLPQTPHSPATADYTANHLQSGLQLLDLVIRKWTGKKYLLPTLTQNVDEQQRTAAAELAYAAYTATKNKILL